MEQVYIYSTASTVAAFVNGYHIEQAYGFNYKESVPKIPIYGYNDYEFSKVVRGKGVVQGILVVNFVFPGYLSAVLTYRNDVYNPKLYNYQLPGNPGQFLPSTQKQIQDKIFKDLETELPANNDTQSKAARATYIANLITSSKSNPSDIATTKNALNKFFSVDLGDINDVSNARNISRRITSPLVADSSPVVGNQIDIYYQDPDLCSWFVRFNNVHFTEVSQSISQAGADGSSEPLYEIYEFIAKNKEIIEIK
jgi:hypothetical protein